MTPQMKDPLEGLLISVSEHKPKTHDDPHEATVRKERRRGRHTDRDGTPSLATSRSRSSSGRGLSRSSSRSRFSRWPSDSNTLRRNHTFDGELIGRDESTRTLNAKSSHGASTHASSSMRKTMSNPNLLIMKSAESKSTKKNKKIESSKSTKIKKKVTATKCDASNTLPIGLSGSNSTHTVDATSNFNLTLEKVNFEACTLIEHANLILRHRKADRLKSSNISVTGDGSISSTQSRTTSRRGTRRASTFDEARISRLLCSSLVMDNDNGGMKAGKEPFPSFLF